MKNLEVKLKVGTAQGTQKETIFLYFVASKMREIAFEIVLEHLLTDDKLCIEENRITSFKVVSTLVTLLVL